MPIAQRLPERGKTNPERFSNTLETRENQVNLDDGSRAKGSSSRSRSAEEHRDLALRQTPTDRLTDDQVRRAQQASDAAVRAGRPLNRFITINWQQGGITDPTEATRLFVKLARDWCRYHGQATAHLWTIENGAVSGLHAHILIHVPQDLGRSFGSAQRRWLSRLGWQRTKGGVLTRHLGGRPSGYRRLLEEAPDAEIMIEYRRLIAYLLKCCSFEAARSLGGHFRARSSEVWGERIGFYRAGPAAHQSAPSRPPSSN